MGKGVHSIDTGALAEERDPLQRQWDGQIIFYLEGIASFSWLQNTYSETLIHGLISFFFNFN